MGSIHKGFSETPLIQEVSASMRGLLRMHSPRLLITVDDLPSAVIDALKLATSQAAVNVSLVQIPHSSFSRALWIPTVPPASLTCKYFFPSCKRVRESSIRARQLIRVHGCAVWSKMRIQINIITQNRAPSLARLLQSLTDAHYLGDTIDISFNMDSAVDAPTLNLIDSFHWPHGQKIVRRRIIQGGLIRAVSESW